MIPTEHAILSEKDTKHQLQKDFDGPFLSIKTMAGRRV